MRDLLRQIAAENELEVMSGKAARDHDHLLLSHRPYQGVSQIMQWLKGTSSRVLLQEFAHLRKKFRGKHLWARGYLAVSSGTITDEMIRHAVTKCDLCEERVLAGGVPRCVETCPSGALSFSDVSDVEREGLLLLSSRTTGHHPLKRR